MIQTRRDKMFTHAITRKPGANFADGLTQGNLGAPDFELITQQHAAYVEVLKLRGLTVTELEPVDAHPDGYFVEDPAIVTPKVAIITIPGAPARRGEQESLEEVLCKFRPTAHITPPGTVDGGDILMVGNHFFIGISARTNAEGARQLGVVLERYGHAWTTVDVQNGLHLKSDVNYIGDNTLLLTPGFAHRKEFKDFERIILNADETYAANTLLLNDCLIVPRGFPDTLGKMRHTGHDIVELDVSEVQKMDGGLTCMSIRF